MTDQTKNNHVTLFVRFGGCSQFQQGFGILVGHYKFVSPLWWSGLADMFINRKFVFDVDATLIKTVFNELNY
ncbi:hypothetical protein CO179_06085 [candidate division WWE3 bacterium CG_4_9_14_3_um_filter_39_7]|uniref:Uncharacterized protein n=1 Tax=candidate division WWE3 bacterium CG_4_9_14_3_um_filter_39_7 TaxID=1975080 RepID=A0A2M7WZR1_UNCKA|nr:MAG: hypothetical protein CO179_06085 [candidate division WWE3 bacterium CG_4_9_14_3_um_filter_39_7]